MNRHLEDHGGCNRMESKWSGAQKLLNHLLNICAKFDIAARCVGDGIGFGKATKVCKLGLAIS